MSGIGEKKFLIPNDKAVSPIFEQPLVLYILMVEEKGSIFHGVE